MKICMISRAVQAHGKGGMEDHIQMLTDGLSNKRYEITIVTTRHPEGKEYEKRGLVETYYLKNSIPGKYSKRWLVDSVKKFEELNKTKKFDIFHSQSGSGLYFFKESLNKKYGLPTVISMHGTSYDEIRTQINMLKVSKSLHSSDIREAIYAPARILKYLRAYYFWDKLIMRNADAIIATSVEQGKLLSRFYSVPKSKIFTVFNGVDTDIFRPGQDSGIRKRYGIRKDEKLLLCVARLRKEKGIQNLIHILPRIIKEHPTKLIVVGDGVYRKTLEDLVKKHGVKGNVIFTGFVRLDELPEYFNACDIFINATIRQDGYDLTILEAMACGKPVIASNIGSMPTAVAQGEDGILIPRGDKAALERRILELLSDPALCARLGGNARKKVAKQFSVDSMVAGTIGVYKIATERKKHGQAQ